MKNKLIRVSAVLVLLSSASSVLLADDKVKNYNTDNIEQFQFERGLKVGLREGYMKGYRDALNFAKEQLRLYKKEIKAFEAGKYLEEYKHKVTAPALYQLKNGDSVKVIVKGCTIARPLSPDEIIDLPIYPLNYKVDNIEAPEVKCLNDNGKVDCEFVDDDEANKYTNSADIVGRDGNGFYTERPENPYTDNRSYIYLKNTVSNRHKLELLNRNYTINGDMLKVSFYDLNDRKVFMKNFFNKGQ